MIISVTIRTRHLTNALLYDMYPKLLFILLMVKIFKIQTALF